jgi:hypothetical protein
MEPKAVETVDYPPSEETLVKEAKSILNEPEQRRKAGRPKKGEIVAKKTKNKGVLGRPKGDTAIINEYKARMLNSPKSAKVLEAIYDAALNDDHKNQAAAWKLIVDRIVPVSAFEATKSAGGTPQISINISGLQGPTVDMVEDVTDVESKMDVEVKDYSSEEDNG